MLGGCHDGGTAESEGEEGCGVQGGYLDGEGGAGVVAEEVESGKGEGFEKEHEDVDVGFCVWGICWGVVGVAEAGFMVRLECDVLGE